MAQCKAHKRSGAPCRRFALNGSEFCALHGGRPRSHLVGVRVPRFYSKYLHTTLRQAVTRAMSRDDATTFSLREELAIIRVSASRAVHLYSAVHRAAQEGTVKEESLAEACGIMHSALQEVVRTCEAAARVESMARDKIPAVNLHLAVQQVVKVIYTVLGDEHQELAERINAAIEENLMVADGAPVGTSLTPDQDVLEMDASVP